MVALQAKAAVVVGHWLNCMPLYSVIIPILNERAKLPNLCEALSQLTVCAAIEVIFVDGGSEDDSVVWLKQNNFTVITAQKGRAYQMNAGAKLAQGEWLIFLHADTYMPATFFTALAAQPSHVAWGHARVKLDDNTHIASWVERGIAFRAAISGVATGDQTLFVRRNIFNAMGGYEPILLMEDVALSRKLNRYYDKAILPVEVATSSRKWRKNGYIKTIILMWCIQLAYVCGVSTNRLHRWYYGGRL